jgi:hypothetical protein
MRRARTRSAKWAYKAAYSGVVATSIGWPFKVITLPPRDRVNWPASVSTSNIPGLRAGLEKIQIHADFRVLRVAHREMRGDGRGTVLGKRQFRVFEHNARNQVSEYGQGVDPRIEDPQAAGLPYPTLAGMPDPDVFFPGHGDAAKRSTREPGSRRLDRGCVP